LEDISISSKSAMQVLQVKFVKTFSINISNTGDTFLRVPDNSDRDKSAVSEDKSARKRGLVGPYVKTTRTINKIDGNHKDTVWHLSTVLGNVKKKKTYFFQKIIVKSFLDRFLQMLHQHIRNCLYFDWLFTHYVVMSDFYLYII
jgi:hypothetical protein